MRCKQQFCTLLPRTVARAATVLLLFAAVLLSPHGLRSFADEKKTTDTMNSIQRGQALQMLKETADTVRKQYYDPAYHGVNFEARYTEAEQRVRGQVPTLSDAFGVIAWMLDGLNDSHTFPLPPPRPFIVEDGWEATFIGDNCFITALKEGSDAAAKGLKPGDQVVSVEGFRAKRETWWKVEYALQQSLTASGDEVGCGQSGRAAA